MISYFFNFRCDKKIPDDKDGKVFATLKNYHRKHPLTKIIKKLTKFDQVDLCYMLNISIPNIYPIVFKEYNDKVFPQEPYKLLKQYLNKKSHMILPKHIILESDMGEIYLGPKVTKPKPKLALC